MGPAADRAQGALREMASALLAPDRATASQAELALRAGGREMPAITPFLPKETYPPAAAAPQAPQRDQTPIRSPASYDAPPRPMETYPPGAPGAPAPVPPPYVPPQRREEPAPAGASYEPPPRSPSTCGGRPAPRTDLAGQTGHPVIGRTDMAGEARRPVVASGHVGRRADSPTARGSCAGAGRPRAGSAHIDLGPRSAAHRGAGTRSRAAGRRGEAHLDFDSDALVSILVGPDVGRRVLPGLRTCAYPCPCAGRPGLRSAYAVHVHEHTCCAFGPRPRPCPQAPRSPPPGPHLRHRATALAGACCRGHRGAAPDWRRRRHLLRQPRIEPQRWRRLTGDLAQDIAEDVAENLTQGHTVAGRRRPPGRADICAPRHCSTDQRAVLLAQRDLRRGHISGHQLHVELNLPHRYRYLLDGSGCGQPVDLHAPLLRPVHRQGRHGFQPR
jgi:hypothetical protein